MSLRTDVHRAFDVIAPETGGMAERVIEMARREARTNERRGSFVIRMRAPLSLVAVVLVIALIVAALVGGRLVQEWNAHRPSQAGGPQSVVLPTLSELEARPWLHPVLAASDGCVSAAFTGTHIGTGPIYSYPLSLTSNAWGEYSTGQTVIDRGFSGLLIVRLRDARTGKRDVFVNENARGAVLGTDTLDGQAVQHHPEAVFDTSDPSIKAAGDGRKTFLMTAGHQLGFSGCWEWQYDGTFNGRPYVWSFYFSA